MRMVLCLLLGLIAMFFAFIGTTMPLRLPAQAANDRAYYEQFKDAAASIEKNQQVSAEEVLRRIQPFQSYPYIQSSPTIPLDCNPSFRKAPTDRLILSFWRGEWTECYAIPSGRTTLPMSVSAYLLSGLGISLALYWLFAVAAAWGAIRLRPRRSG